MLYNNTLHWNTHRDVKIIVATEWRYVRTDVHNALSLSSLRRPMQGEHIRKGKHHMGNPRACRGTWRTGKNGVRGGAIQVTMFVMDLQSKSFWPTWGLFICVYHWRSQHLKSILHPNHNYAWRLKCDVFRKIIKQESETFRGLNTGCRKHYSTDQCVPHQNFFYKWCNYAVTKRLSFFGDCRVAQEIHILRLWGCENVRYQIPNGYQRYPYFVFKTVHGGK